MYIQTKILKDIYQKRAEQEYHHYDPCDPCDPCKPCKKIICPRGPQGHQGPEGPPGEVPLNLLCESQGYGGTATESVINAAGGPLGQPLGAYSVGLGQLKPERIILGAPPLKVTNPISRATLSPTVLQNLCFRAAVNLNQTQERLVEAVRVLTASAIVEEAQIVEKFPCLTSEQLAVIVEQVGIGLQQQDLKATAEAIIAALNTLVIGGAIYVDTTGNCSFISTLLQTNVSLDLAAGEVCASNQNNTDQVDLQACQHFALLAIPGQISLGEDLTAVEAALTATITGLVLAKDVFIPALKAVGICSREAYKIACEIAEVIHDPERVALVVDRLLERIPQGTADSILITVSAGIKLCPLLVQ